MGALPSTPAELAELAVLEHRAQQDPDELAKLAEYLVAAGPFERVLEIGVRHGGTLWLWRRLGARAWGIDLELPPCADCDRRRAHNDCPRQHVAGDVGLLVADSSSPLALEWAGGLARRHGLFDMLHVDGDHSEEACRRDVELYAPLVRAGGTIVLHDVEHLPEVKTVYLELFAERGGAGCFTLHGERGGMGIGVIPAL